MKIKPASPQAMELFLKGQQVFAKIEANGLRVDVDRLEKTLTNIAVDIEDKEEQLRNDSVFTEWKKRYREKTNLGSLPQLGTVLFDCLKVPYPFDRTATGRFRTDSDTLSKVDHPFVKEYSKLGDLTSIRGKLKGIQRELCGDRIHPSFNLASGEEDKGGGARSYRSSSSQPNAQNLPIRDLYMARIIRPLFLPEIGDCWGEFDFSGIEVRISACHNKDPNLIKYVTDSSTDMHRDEAANLFFLSVDYLKQYKDWAKRTIRDAAKNQWVFPQFYGSVWFQCAIPIWERMLKDQWILPDGIPMTEHLKNNGVKRLGRCIGGQDPEPHTFGAHLKKCEGSLWNDRFPVYARWKRDTWTRYQETGQIRFPTGFIAQGHMRRNQTANISIQGSSFHCELLTLIWMQEAIEKYRMKTRLTSTIHDSTNASIPPRELEDILEMAEEMMTRRLPKHWPWIIVPMSIECEISGVDQSWYEKKLVSPISCPEQNKRLTFVHNRWEWQ